MTLTSLTITQMGKAEVTKLVTGLGTQYHYAAICVGNNDTAATERYFTIDTSNTCGGRISFG